jgi:hypothetical protein
MLPAVKRFRASRNFARFVGVSAHEKHTVILPSGRVESQARELGWQSRIVAAGASDDALLEVLSTLS